MSKAILLLSAIAAASAIGAPVLAQSYEQSSASGYEHSVVQSGSSYEASSEAVQVGGARLVDARAYGSASSEDVQFSQSSSFQSAAYGARAHWAAHGQAHHTTDAAGYLTWAGKIDDHGPIPRGDFAGGPACPSAHGERVLSCQFVSFAPPPQAIAINDEDFAYEGSVGPGFLGDNGGGGGGGGGSDEGFAGASASAGGFASASVSASVSVRASAHAHYGGHYGGHGGGHWGHMGGGHTTSSCGCKK